MAVVLGMSACDNRKQQEENNFAQDSLRSVIAQKENEINDLVGILNEVQEGFAVINAAQNRINVGRVEGGDNREMLRENMAEIHRTMQMNRELISTLRQQLKDSNLYSNELKRTLEATVERMTREMEAKTSEIEYLQAELAKKDATIAEQATQITNLNENVRSLNEQNTTKSATVAQQDIALHTAYYVFGTKRELRQHNIIDGRDVLRSGNFAKDYFTKIDVRTTKVVRLYSKSAKLMTSHPSGSYTLEKDSQGQYTLRITDVDQFWSISKYLVVLVK